MSNIVRCYNLSTIDNPYNPFDEWDMWLSYDLGKGYDCCGLLARFCVTSDSLTTAENQLFIKSAIEEIVAQDTEGLYIMVAQDIDEYEDLEELLK